MESGEGVEMREGIEKKESLENCIRKDQLWKEVALPCWRHQGTKRGQLTGTDDAEGPRDGKVKLSV